jgi:ribosome-associated toxin RatA of RatAB toxin-antitoxin module
MLRPMSGDPSLRYAELEIPVASDVCYQALCDVESVPDWVPGVASVLVRERDAQSRVLSAVFVGMPGRGSFAYDLIYRYDDDTLTMRWSSSDRTLRELEGEARVEPLSDTSCKLTYGLHSWSTAIAPMWAQIELREEVPTPVVNAFARWLAKRG